MPYGPDPQEWKFGKLFLQEIITSIDKRLWDIFNNQDLPETVVIPIGEDVSIIVLDESFRQKLQDVYLKAGWGEVSFDIHFLSDEDDEFEITTDRQVQILKGKLPPDINEKPIPAYWQIILRK